MRHLLLVCLGLLVPFSLKAKTEPEQDLVPLLNRVIDQLSLDLVREINGLESFLLVQNPDDASVDLYVLRDHREQQGNRLLLFVRDVAFSGAGLYGARPSLARSEQGSLLPHSELIGWGRNPWDQTLTIAWRDDRLVVAGFTHSFRDRTNLSYYGSCDFNLLSGIADLAYGRAADPEGAPGYQERVEGPPLALPLSDYSSGWWPGICNPIVDPDAF